MGAQYLGQRWILSSPALDEIDRSWFVGERARRSALDKAGGQFAGTFLVCRRGLGSKRAAGIAKGHGLWGGRRRSGPFPAQRSLFTGESAESMPTKPDLSLLTCWNWMAGSRFQRSLFVGRSGEASRHFCYVRDGVIALLR